MLSIAPITLKVMTATQAQTAFTKRFETLMAEYDRNYG